MKIPWPEKVDWLQFAALVLLILFLLFLPWLGPALR